MNADSNNVIFLVGPAAAGKSTFGHFLSKNLQIPLVSDLDALSQLFHSNDAIPPKREPDYWPELSAHQSVAERLREATAPVPTGGYTILQDEVWLESLERTVNHALQVTKGVIIEYARGATSSVPFPYLTSFEHLYRTLPMLAKANSVIVHITAPYTDRVRRNNQRRNLGGHFVAHEVMSTVYREDAFIQDCGNRELLTLGDLCAIPVIVFQNLHLESLPNSLNQCYQWILQHLHFPVLE